MSIPEGFKLVPVEPTENMVIHGFESAPNECFTDYKVWDAYQEMSGCQQAALRAKLCWAAMLAAAPSPPQPIFDEVVAWEVSGNGVKPGLFNYKPLWAVEDPAYTVRELVYAQSRAKAGEDE